MVKIENERLQRTYFLVPITYKSCGNRMYRIQKTLSENGK